MSKWVHKCQILDHLYSVLIDYCWGLLYSTMKDAYLNNLHWTYLLTREDASKHINTIDFSDYD